MSYAAWRNKYQSDGQAAKAAYIECVRLAEACLRLAEELRELKQKSRDDEFLAPQPLAKTDPPLLYIERDW